MICSFDFEIFWSLSEEIWISSVLNCLVRKFPYLIYRGGGGERFTCVLIIRRINEIGRNDDSGVG